MAVSGPGGLEIASIRRRVLASLIDAVLFVPPASLAGIGAVKAYTAYRRRGSGEDEAEFSFDHGLFNRFAEPRWRLAIWAVSMPIEIRLRNWRSPGARALGLRRLDARTGGPVSVRSALIHNAVQTVSGELNRLARRPFDKRFAERRQAIEEERGEIARIHADDHEAQQRATTELYRRHRVGLGGSCTVGLLGLVPKYLPAFWSERRQTLPQRAAGIMTVVERDGAASPAPSEAD